MVRRFFVEEDLAVGALGSGFELDRRFSEVNIVYVDTD